VIRLDVTSADSNAVRVRIMSSSLFGNPYRNRRPALNDLQLAQITLACARKSLRPDWRRLF
jgi:hypothetical protein